MPVSDDAQLFLDSLNNPASSAIYSEAPSADTSGFLAAQTLSDRTGAMTDERLSELTCGTASGASSGNTGRGLRTWGQGFLSSSHEGGRDGLQGNDTHTAGGAIGTDVSNWIDNAVVGASLSYARTGADARDPTQADTDINSYQLTVYGDYDLGDHAFVRGLLGYARSTNDETRRQFGDTMKGSYGANEYSFLVKAGKAFKTDSLTFTPSMLAHWIHYSPDDYTETGLSALHASQNDVNVLEVGPSVDATWKVKSVDGSWLVPSVHAGVRYDLAGERITTTYSGGCCGTFTSLSPIPAQARFNLGGSMSVYTTSAWEFKAGYDLDYKRDFLANTGMFRGTLRY